MENVKKGKKVVKEDVSNVLPVTPVIETPVISSPIVTSEPKTEISELEKIREENKVLQKKLAEVSAKKSPGFQKTGKAGYDIVYDFLVKAMSAEGKLPVELDYMALTSLVRSEIHSESYNNAKMESRYFGIMLSYVTKRFDLVEKPVQAEIPVKVDVTKS